MKKSYFTILFALISVSFLLILTSFSPNENREATPGTVTFTVTTKPAGGNYSPKHVLAIWVEKDGDFVKTRKAMANQRKQYLYTWKASSNYNVVDAITGPTLNTHQTHAIEWDCTDLDGNVVEDGTYTMLIEFTDKHAQGPLFSIDFDKAGEPVTINPPNQQYFTNMELTYQPDVTVIADFSADITEACPGEEIVFTDNSTGASSWSWNFGFGAMPETATGQGPHTVTYSTAGNKSVSLTINGDVTQTKNDYITIFPEPQSDFTHEQMSRTVDFTNLSQNAISYLWDFGDGNTSIAQNPSHTYAEDGTYFVSLTATSEHCGSDVHEDTIVINTVGISETINNDVMIQPNPASGKFAIVSDAFSGNVEIGIFDLKGKQIWPDNGMQEHNGLISVSVSENLRPGIYFVRIKNLDAEIVKKLVIR